LEIQEQASAAWYKETHELGIQPDLIVCRSERQIGRGVREKLSISSDVAVRKEYTTLWDYGNVYEIPLLLKELRWIRHI